MRPLSLGPAVASAARNRGERLDMAASATAPPVMGWRAERRETLRFRSVINAAFEFGACGGIRRAQPGRETRYGSERNGATRDGLEGGATGNFEIPICD